MKIVIISDTHNLTCELPVGDLLIHCGDLTKHGYRSEVYKQLGWLEEQRDKFKNAILIPGNHDFYFERHQEEAREACLAAGLIMLVNETVTIDGMKFFGTPNTNVYHDWAFNSSNQQMEEIVARIPNDTDVLISHGPPAGILDNHQGDFIGSVELLSRVLELKPKLHAFGHVHESYGTLIKEEIQFVNAAMATKDGLRSPIVINL